MARFRLSSLLSPSSSSERSEDKTEVKKQNRRSFSAFSAKPSPKPKKEDVQSNGTAAVAKKPDAVAESPSRMVVLAQKISKETEKLEAYFKANGLPSPSFDAEAPSDFPKLPEDIQKSRREVIFATKELRDLAVGPRESVRWGVWNVSFSLDLLPLSLPTSFSGGQWYRISNMNSPAP